MPTAVQGTPRDKMKDPPVPPCLELVMSKRHPKKNIKDYWHFICSAQPSAVSWYQKTTQQNMMDTKIKKSHQEMDRWYKHSKSTAKGKGKGETNAKGKAKGKGKHNSAKDIIVDNFFFPHLDAFKHASDGMVADVISFSELH